MVKLHVDSFAVVGIEGRTSNDREASGEGVIGPMWARLSKEDLLSKIPNKVDSRIVTVYSNYESDKDGAYDYLLGTKVSSAHNIPEGMIVRKVVAGDYAMFTSENTPQPQGVVTLWKHIWSLEKPGQLHRAYKTDFEVYEGAGSSRVDIYIGLKNDKSN